MNKSLTLRLLLLGSSASAITFLAAPAMAADAAAAAEVDQIVVTGSRASGRTVETSPAPIDVVSAQELQQVNQPNLLDALNTLLPSFNLPTVGTPDIGSMVRAGQLRGLSPDQTLILVDGKRRHSTAFLGAGGFSASTPADLSLIPSAAIDHVEVLRDGASAIYGSDAIAGVINIITKSGAHGGGISVEGGQFYSGDGLTGIGKFDLGTGLGPSGSLHLSGEIDHQDGVVRNFATPSNYLYYFPLNAAGQAVLPGPNNTLPAGAHADPREAGRDPVAWKNTGLPAYTIETIAEDLRLPLNGQVQVYSFGTYSHRRADSPQNFRTPTRDTDVRSIYPDGFAPIEQIDEKDGEIGGGLRGQGLAGWDWDLSSNYGRDVVDAYVRNSLNPTLGAASPTHFYDGELRYSAWTNNLDLRRSFATGLFAGPIDASLGAEYRHEGYVISPGEPNSYIDGGVGILDGPNAGKPLIGSGGAQGLPGFRPEDAVNATREAMRPMPACRRACCRRCSSIWPAATSTTRISAARSPGGSPPATTSPIVSPSEGP